MINVTNNTRLRGASFILISAFFYGTYGAWSRLMAADFGEFSQAWTRGLLLFIFSLLVNIKFKIFKKIDRRDWPWFLMVAFAGGLNQAPYFFGFKHLNIGTAVLLFYSALVIGGYLIGKLVFQEKLTFIKYLSLGLAILGIGTIYNLALTQNQFLPAALTIMAGLMGAIAAVMPKKLSGHYAELQIMTGYFIVMVLANSLLGHFLNESLPPFSKINAWGAQLGYATAMLLANLAVIQGFKYIEASIGSLIGLAEILFGISFGVLFFGEKITLGVIVGAILIITSATLPNLKKETLDS